MRPRGHLVRYMMSSWPHITHSLCVIKEESASTDPRYVHPLTFPARYVKSLKYQGFVVRTDHSALQWLRSTPEPIGQQ